LKPSSRITLLKISQPHAIIDEVQNTAVSVQKNTLSQLAFIIKTVQWIQHLGLDSLVELFLLVGELNTRFFIKLLFYLQLMLLPQQKMFLDESLLILTIFLDLE